MKFKAGEHNVAAILTPELVQQLRQLQKLGWSYQQLGDEFGIDRKHAWRICKHQAWQSVQ